VLTGVAVGQIMRIYERNFFFFFGHYARGEVRSLSLFPEITAFFLSFFSASHIACFVYAVATSAPLMSVLDCHRSCDFSLPVLAHIPSQPL
jgi:hypothetical protein